MWQTTLLVKGEQSGWEPGPSSSQQEQESIQNCARWSTENKAEENCPSRLLRPYTIDHIQLWIRITVQYTGGRTLKMLQRSSGLPHPPKDQAAGHSTSVSKGGAETQCSYEGTAAWHSHRQFIINECDWLCSNRSLWSLKYEYQIILTYKINFFWFFLTS